MSRREQEHLIQTVYPGSIAEELEIEPGDVLLKINGQKIEDVFDYRYLMKDEYVEVLIRKPSGVEWLLEIDKDYDDELGVEFENGLMSEYRSCSNKCMFCFIDQMPPGMRETLYFKDDDSRLSFLQGNYITMTNMKQAVLRNMRDEIPHGTAVDIEKMREREGSGMLDIEATIYCEKESHKGMIIGRGGAMLKKIASEARTDLETFLDTKVNLKCWVKVRDDWRNNENAIKQVGLRYEE